MKSEAFQPISAFDEMRQIFQEDSILPNRKSNSHMDGYSVNSVIDTPCGQDYNLRAFEVKEESVVQCSNVYGLTGAWKTQSLQIISIIMRLVFQLKTRIYSTKLKMVTERIFNLIDDAAADYLILDNNRKNNLTKNSEQSCIQLFKYILQFKLQHCLKQVDKLIPTLAMNSQVLLIQQIMMLVALTVNIFYIPINLSFLREQDNPYLQTIPHIIFAIWIVVCCNTAIHLDDILRTDRYTILIYYCRNFLLFDSFIIIPYLFRGIIYDYSELSFFLKIVQLQRILEQFEYNNTFKEKVSAMIDLFKLFAFLVLITHCCACGWHYLAVYQEEDLGIHNNWLNYYQYNDRSWSDRYVVSLYWSVITTLTVGYGDITPQTILEQLYVIFVAMIICGLLGYTITRIGEIFKQINEKKLMYKQQMKAVDQLVRQRGLNTQLQIKVRKYFHQLLLKEQDENRLGEQLMAKLTKSLEDEVLIDTYRNVLKKSTLLKNFKDKTIERLCTKMQTAQYSPGNEVLKCSSQAEHLIFLISGNLNMSALVGRSNITLKSLGPGFVIGEQEFVQYAEYDYTLSSIGYSKVAYIVREDFYEVLQFDQEESQKMSQIRDTCTFNPNRQNLTGKVCEICGWTHGYLKCPLTFVQLDKWMVIKRYNRNQEQPRQVHFHRRHLKTHCLKMRMYHEQQCTRFQIQNKLYLQNSLLEEQATLTNKGTNLAGSSFVNFSEESIKLNEDSREEQCNSPKKSNQTSISALDEMQRRSIVQMDRSKRVRMETLKPNQTLRTTQQKDSQKLSSDRGLQYKDIGIQYKLQLDDILARLNEISCTQIVAAKVQVQQQLNDYDFEVAQCYTHFNPHYNLPGIVKQINQLQQKSLEKITQNRRISKVMKQKKTLKGQRVKFK